MLQPTDPRIVTMSSESNYLALLSETYRVSDSVRGLSNIYFGDDGEYHYCVSTGGATVYRAAKRVVSDKRIEKAVALQVEQLEELDTISTEVPFRKVPYSAEFMKWKEGILINNDLVIAARNTVAERRRRNVESK
jgi:hypothetical protein